MTQTGPGFVYLVGAGPGDAGLITEKGRRLLETADVVVYDRLVSPQLLTFVPTHAELVYVGKEVSRHTLPQSQINDRLVAEAQAGRRVIRLKGGDPFVFGRGGEEGMALADAGVPFEVVPGITSAVGALSYAGIPVTHRQVATAFTVVTGHECATDDTSTVDWQHLGSAQTTVVVLMGMGHLATIVDRLLQAGRSIDTPVAVIRWGTRADQQTVVGTLADIVDQVAAARVDPPGIIVVGNVVALRSELSWYEHQPLFGKRYLAVSELWEDARLVASQLTTAGAEVVPMALESFADVNDAAMDGWLTEMLAGCPEPGMAWEFQTGLDAQMFLKALATWHMDLRRFAHVQFGAVSESVAAALRRGGLQPDWVGPSAPTRVAPVGTMYVLKSATDRLHHWLGGWTDTPWQIVAESDALRHWVVEQTAPVDRRALLPDGVEVELS